MWFQGSEVLLLSYTLIRSNRKSIAIEVHPEGIIVRAPCLASQAQIEGFLQQKADWMNQRLPNHTDQKQGGIPHEEVPVDLPFPDLPLPDLHGHC